MFFKNYLPMFEGTLIVHKFSGVVIPLIVGLGLFNSLFLENLLISNKLKHFGLP